MISFISSVGLRAGQLAAKQAPLGPGLPGFSFFLNTAYTVKDYEDFAFFQPVPSETGRFENGPGLPETNTIHFSLNFDDQLSFFYF